MEEEIDVELAERLLLQYELEEEKRRVQQVIRNHNPLKFKTFVEAQKRKSFFSNKIEMFKASLESFFPDKWDLIESNKDVQIIIHFPEFYIEEIDQNSNSTGKKELLKDAYINFAFIKDSNNFYFSPTVYITRTTFNINHFNPRKSYCFIHSHAKTSFSNYSREILEYRKDSIGQRGYKNKFTTFCTGSHVLNTILNRLADDINQTTFESVLYAIDVMIRQESNAGGPYHRFKDYPSASQTKEIEFYTNYHLKSKIKNSEQKTVQLLSKYRLLNYYNYKHLLKIKNDFLKELTDSLIDKYIYKSEITSQECEWHDSLLIKETSNLEMFEKVNYSNVFSDVSDEPIEVLRFKGQPVYLEIYKESLETKGIYKKKPKRIIPNVIKKYSEIIENYLYKYDKLKFNTKYKIS